VTPRQPEDDLYVIPGDQAVPTNLLPDSCMPNISVEGKTPLMTAVSEGTLEMVLSVLVAGACVNAKKTVDGATAFDLAVDRLAQRGTEGWKIFRMLAGVQGDSEVTRDTFMKAIQQKQVKAVKEILEWRMLQVGPAEIFEAARNDNKRSLEHMLIHAVDPNQRIRLVNYDKYGIEDEYRQELVNHEGKTALWEAANLGHDKIVQLLTNETLNPDVDVDAVDERVNRTPLHTAMKHLANHNCRRKLLRKMLRILELIQSDPAQKTVELDKLIKSRRPSDQNFLKKIRKETFWSLINVETWNTALAEELIRAYATDMAFYSKRVRSFKSIGTILMKKNATLTIEDSKKESALCPLKPMTKIVKEFTDDPEIPQGIRDLLSKLRRLRPCKHNKSFQPDDRHMPVPRTGTMVKNSAITRRILMTQRSLTTMRSRMQRRSRRYPKMKRKTNTSMRKTKEEKIEKGR